MSLLFLILCAAGYAVVFLAVVSRMENKRGIPAAAILTLAVYACAVLFLRILADMAGSGGNFILAAAGVCTAVYLCFQISRLGRRHTFRMPMVWLLLASLAAVLGVTLILRENGASARTQMIPFSFWKAYIRSGRAALPVHAILNIVLFVPIGLFYAAAGKEPAAGLFSTAGFGVSLTFAIEVTQLVTHRGLCDVDDITMNTLGTVLGFFLAKAAMMLMREDRGEETSL